MTYPSDMTPKQSEHSLQSACVKWFRLQYPHLKTMLFAIPNGAKRTRWERGRFIEDGGVAGVADLFLAVPKSEGYEAAGNEQRVNGLFIEMKLPHTKQTQAQVEFMTNVRQQGYRYIVCRSFEDFSDVIKDYLS